MWWTRCRRSKTLPLGFTRSSLQICVSCMFYGNPNNELKLKCLPGLHGRLEFWSLWISGSLNPKPQTHVFWGEDPTDIEQQQASLLKGSLAGAQQGRGGTDACSSPYITVQLPILGTSVIPFYPFYLGVSLLKLTTVVGKLIIKGLLGSLESRSVSVVHSFTLLPRTTLLLICVVIRGFGSLEGVPVRRSTWHELDHLHLVYVGSSPHDGPNFWYPSILSAVI